MSYLTFHPFFPPKPRKTECWLVSARGIAVGQVRWFSRWRQYAFFPITDTVFEEDCLREIANFVERETREYRAK